MKKKTFSQVFMLNESYLLISNVQATPTQLYHYVHNASMLVPVATMLNTIPVIKTAINWDTLELIFSATQFYDFTISRKGLNILWICFFYDWKWKQKYTKNKWFKGFMANILKKFWQKYICIQILRFSHKK